MEFMKEEIEQLEKYGSNKDILEEVADKLDYNLKYSNGNLETSLNRIVTDIQIATTKFLGTSNEYGVPVTNAISSSIYIPDIDNNTELYLTFLASGQKKINEYTRFDVASITKIYTLLLAYRLEEIGFFSFQDKISDLNPNFSGLNDFTIEDLIMLHGEMKTLGNIADATNEKEARDILNTIHLTNDDRTRNKYTDFGSIVLGETMAYVVSRHNNLNYTFETLLKEYLLEPLRIYPEDTIFNPKNDNLLGQGDNTNLVHDPKTKALGNVSGAAGIYTTSRGLAILANRMFNSKNYSDFYDTACTKDQLIKMGTHTYPKGLEPHKGLFGLYLKHPYGKETFAPSAYSNLVFAHQGYTGSLAVFDSINNIHNSILVDSITKEKGKIGYGANQKPIGFMDAFDKYENELTKETLISMLVKKYYEKKNKEFYTIQKRYRIG